jgi:hypothetical protein
MVQDRYFYDPKTQPIRSIVTWTIWTNVTAASIRPCLAARIPLVASSVDGQTMRAIRVLRTAWGITVAFGNGRAGLWAAPNRLVEEPAFPPASSPARAAKRLRICLPISADSSKDSALFDEMLPGFPAKATVQPGGMLWPVRRLVRSVAKPGDMCGPNSRSVSHLAGNEPDIRRKASMN